MSHGPGFCAAVAALVLAGGAARADSVHLFSYDPADATTRQAAGPLTFTFRKGLFHLTLLNLRSTEATATAYLKPADEKSLGLHGRSAAIAAALAGRDLYRVEDAAEGSALVSAFCPGQGRAWMAFGPVRPNRDLTVMVIGAPAKGGEAVPCQTLKFSFHGEWTLPPGRTIDALDLKRPRFPGS